MNKALAIGMAVLLVIVILVTWAYVSLNAPNEDLDRFNRNRECRNNTTLFADVDERIAWCDYLHEE